VPPTWSTPRFRHPDETHAALVDRYFGDTSAGASMERFLLAPATVITERAAALAVRAARAERAPEPTP